MENAVAENVVKALGLRHVLLVFASPRALFSRVEDTGAYGLALVVLLALVLLLGYSEVQTGLIDRGVDQSTEKRLAELEENQGKLIDRVELRDRMETIRKEGDFLKTITRIQAVVISPIYFLGSFLFIAAVQYAVVALTGRKPEWHTLMSICVYAGFIELAAFALRFGMVLYFRTIEVDTSLRALASSPALKFLGAVDPFRLWFWVLAGVGLAVTQQLSRRMAVVTATFMGMIAVGARVGLEYVSGS